jgi:hypothetical protein
MLQQFLRKVKPNFKIFKKLLDKLQSETLSVRPGRIVGSSST